MYFLPSPQGQRTQDAVLPGNLASFRHQRLIHSVAGTLSSGFDPSKAKTMNVGSKEAKRIL
jgi:hypothetical protein